MGNTTPSIFPPPAIPGPSRRARNPPASPLPLFRGERFSIPKFGPFQDLLVPKKTKSNSNEGSRLTNARGIESLTSFHSWLDRVLDAKLTNASLSAEIEIADTRRLRGEINALWMWRRTGPLGVPTKAIATREGLEA